MIDFHSHILPNIDDGSKSVEESLGMLRMLKEQGIAKVVATPHFYANQNSIAEFLEKRSHALNILSDKVDADMPEIILGAEVKYYEGISRLNNLSDLCIGGSKLLLLEMSMRKWTEYTLRELSELAADGGIKIVLAHIERYLRFQQKGLIQELVNNGILIQANAEFFLSMGSRHRAFSMLNGNLIHFIGSDCHDLVHRPPRIGEAVSLIKRKTGNEFVAQMSDFSDSCLIK